MYVCVDVSEHVVQPICKTRESKLRARTPFKFIGKVCLKSRLKESFEKWQQRLWNKVDVKEEGFYIIAHEIL